MKVLMISIDRGLLGQGQLGDVVERHKKYGEHVQQLDVIVFADQQYEVNKISDHVTVYPTKSSGKTTYAQDAKKIGKELFEKNKYDLIVTQEPFFTGWVGFRLKREFGAKLLVHFHGDFWENKNWLKESPLNPVLLMTSKFIAKQADAIRVMSEGQKEKLIKGGISEDKISVISTPVDVDKFYKPEVQSAGSKKVLHVGRFDPAKDFETLAQVFEKVSGAVEDVECIQLGGGQQAQEILKNATVHPIVNQNKIVNFLNTVDVLVLSSTNESFGKVLVEANAAGKPVVSTETTGAREIINNGYNGYLVPIGDAQALASKIIELLNNPDKAKEMGDNGRKFVQEKYGDNTERIIELWNKVAS